MSIRLLPALAALGIACAATVGLHAILSGGLPAATPVVRPAVPPATSPAEPGPAAGIVLPVAPVAVATADPLRGLWGSLNHDTATYVSGEMRMLSELEAVIADQAARLLAHLGGR
jgi:hypothetical protein